MPMKVGGVYAEVRAENKKLKSDLRKAHKQIDSFAGSAQKSINRISFKKVIAGLGVGVLLYNIKSIGMASLQAASDLEETASKFETVFEGMSQEANAMASELVDSYAMSTREAKQYLANVQDLLVPMGMAGKAAFNMSEKVVKLSADLASFNNLPTADVMRNLQSALVGEFEPMRKFGVALSAATIQQEALNSGLVQTKDDINAAVKAQAAMNIIMRSTTKAQGDQIRTMDSYANQQKQMKANWEDISASIGEEALPALASYMKTINRLIKGKSFDSFAGGARKAFLFLVRSFNDGLLVIEYSWKALTNTISIMWTDVINDLKSIWLEFLKPHIAALKYIPVLGAKLAKPFEAHANAVKNSTKESKDLLKTNTALLNKALGSLEASKQTYEQEKKRIELEQEAAKNAGGAGGGGGGGGADPAIEAAKMKAEEIKKIESEFNIWKNEQTMTQEAIEIMDLQAQAERWQQAGIDKVAYEQLVINKIADLKKQERERLKSEELAALKRQKALQMKKLDLTISFFNSIDAITGKKSKGIFLMLKAAEIAKAIVSTLSAATQALAIPPAPNFALAGLTKAAGFANVAAIAKTAISGRAIGGPAPGNALIPVGERGPELLQMGPRSGHIIPNNRIDNTNNSKSMVVNQTNNFNISGFFDELGLKQLVRNTIAPELVDMTERDTEGFKTDFAMAQAN